MRLKNNIAYSISYAQLMADRVGFEPTIPVKVLRISSAVPSTTRPPVRFGPDYLTSRQDSKNPGSRLDQVETRSSLSSPTSQRTSALALGDSSGATMARPSRISSARSEGRIDDDEPRARETFLGAEASSEAPTSMSMRSAFFTPAARISPLKARASPADLIGNHKQIDSVGEALQPIAECPCLALEFIGRLERRIDQYHAAPFGRRQQCVQARIAVGALAAQRLVSKRSQRGLQGGGFFSMPFDGDEPILRPQQWRGDQRRSGIEPPRPSALTISR